MKNRLLSFIIGLFLVSFTYNLFLVPNEIVTGGVSGLAIILKNIIDPTLSILVLNISLIILSLITLKLKKTIEFVFGSIMFPIMVYLTSYLTVYIDISSTELILQVIFSAVISGIGLGLVLKAGFSTGGTDITATILSKFKHMSIGHGLLICDGLIIVLGLITYGPVNTIYALINIYIYTKTIDKVLLGISNSKSFYIKTKTPDIICKEISENFGYATAIYETKENEKIVFCNIRADDYFKLRKHIKKIDKLAIYMIVDGYEVINSFKKVIN